MVPRPIRDTCSPLRPTRRRCTSGNLKGRRAPTAEAHSRRPAGRDGGSGRRPPRGAPVHDDLRQRDGPDGWIEVIVLGVVQGLTEFLPISSSAHLRIVGEVFGWDDPGAAFTAVTQLGTEAAVLIYFAARHRADRRPGCGLAAPARAADPDYRLAWLVILGTLPIGVLGLLFEDQIQTAARNLWLIATTLVVFSACCWSWADRVAAGSVDLERHDRRQGRLRVRAGDGADPGRVAVRRHDHRGAVPRAHAARRRPLLVPAGHPGRRRVRGSSSARRPHRRRPERRCR